MGRWSETMAKKNNAQDAKEKRKRLKLRDASVSLTVNDLEKSIAWYQDVLGFSVTDRWEQDGTLMGVEMTAGDVTVNLSQDDWKKGRDRVKGLGFRIYCTTKQNIDKIAARVKAAGGTLEREPEDAPWGARVFAIADPDGFKITIGSK
jgi:glyoxylase I family protein